MIHDLERTEEHVANTWDPSFNWIYVNESFAVDGIIYKRTYKIKDSKGDPDETPGHFISNEGKVGVLCGLCFGALFQLQYGSYEVIARCGNCGKEDEIYSG